MQFILERVGMRNVKNIQSQRHLFVQTSKAMGRGVVIFYYRNVMGDMARWRDGLSIVCGLQRKHREMMIRCNIQHLPIFTFCKQVVDTLAHRGERWFRSFSHICLVHGIKHKKIKNKIKILGCRERKKARPLQGQTVRQMNSILLQRKCQFVIIMFIGLYLNYFTCSVGMPSLTFVQEKRRSYVT